MLPDQPWLVVCPHCNALVWIDELEELGELDPGYRPFIEEPERQVEIRGKQDLIEDARPYRAPTMQEFLRLLESGLSDPERVRYVRLRAWWTANDARRGNPEATPLSRPETQNLEQLAAMLDESNDHHRIMKAEIMRELGRFDEARKLLKVEFPSDLAHAASLIRKLAERGDRIIREIAST